MKIFFSPKVDLISIMDVIDSIIKLVNEFKKMLKSKNGDKIEGWLKKLIIKRSERKINL